MNHFLRIAAGNLQIVRPRPESMEHTQSQRQTSQSSCKLNHPVSNENHKKTDGKQRTLKSSMLDACALPRAGYSNVSRPKPSSRLMCVNSTAYTSTSNLKHVADTKGRRVFQQMQAFFQRGGCARLQRRSRSKPAVLAGAGSQPN